MLYISTDSDRTLSHEYSNVDIDGYIFNNTGDITKSAQ